jgi:hypothetical protein
MAAGNTLPGRIEWVHIMQLSELFRRGVIVPLTDRSAEHLARWSVDDFVSVEFLPIGNESLFEEIWKAGVLQALNAACSIAISDYEEECLQPDTLKTAIAVLTAEMGKIEEPLVRSFVDDLLGLCKSALAKNRRVYFIL